MGFFGRLKSMTNSLTGGAAKVQFDCPDFSYAGPFRVMIQVETYDAPVNVRSVYLNICGKEEVRVVDYDVEYDYDGDRRTTRETIHSTTETVDLRIEIDGEQVLEPNETYNWEVEVELPDQALPVYYGEQCRHTYTGQAGLDCFGNDPDSGWYQLHE